MAASMGNEKNKKANVKANQNQNQRTKNGGKQKSKSKSTSSFFNSRTATLLLCVMGIGVCTFALYVEILKERDPNYVALCDINSWISCSKVLTSRYGKGFGIVDKFVPKDSIFNQPNPVYGIIFYLLEAGLVLKLTTPTAIIQLILSILANVGSVYLGIILYFVLQDFCLVCISTYIINFLVLVANLFSMKTAVSNEVKQQKKKKK